MELHRYLQVLRARWYDIVLLALIGLAGTYAYLHWSAAYEAKATVAVLEPSVTKALGSQSAQVTFAAVAESYRVAERVIQSTGINMDPGKLQSNVDVKLTRSLVPNIAAPLYNVSVKHKDRTTALLLADAVVSESQKVFVEMNTLRPEDVAVVLESLEKRLQQDIKATRDALTKFENDSSAWRLPQLLESQLAFVNTLRQAVLSKADSAAAVVQMQSAVASSINKAQAELNRLQQLKANYADLRFKVDLATSAVTTVSARQQDISLLGNDLARAAADQVAAEQAKLDAARKDLANFESRNRITNFDSEIVSQMGLATELQRQQVTLQAAPSITQSQLDAEQQELDRLKLLMPEYDRLSNEAGNASAQLSQFGSRRLDLMIQGAISPSDFVKPLDKPQIQSSFFLDMIFYTMGTLAGLVAGLLLVYVIAYFDRVPRTVEEVQELVGVTVIGRIPQKKS